MKILGLSALYHDSAAALVVDGELVASAQEERFSRVKHDAAMPLQAMAYVLQAGAVAPDGIDLVAYYDKPLTTFGRVLRSFVDAGPAGFRAFPQAMSSWATNKLWTGLAIEQALASLGYGRPRRPTIYAEHHVSHAAAAYYPSPFDQACILTFDGVGEWATSSIGHGIGARVDLLRELRFPSSLGLLYSTFTLAAGFRVNSGEYKLMGLAPFGEPRFVQEILDHVVNLHADGSFELDMSYFGFLGGKRMTNSRFHQRFGPDREPGEAITQRHCDLARSVQEVVEEVILRMARHGAELTGQRRAVLAGGVALNGVANARLLRDGPFEEIWVQPAAGDAGSAAGCALWAWHEVEEHPRAPAWPDAMHGALLGPAPEPDEVERWLDQGGRPGRRLTTIEAQVDRLAEILAGGEVVAVCRGPMELGPRALGNRSILADPRNAGVQAEINLRVKRRESFRPFAPAVLAERAGEWFDLPGPSPYMSLVVPVRDATPVAERDDPGNPDHPLDLGTLLAAVGGPLPATTHVDGSARVQTVDVERAPWFHALLEAFERKTGCPVLLNTSFNVRGEPIVADHIDAYRCFMSTDIDWLLAGETLLRKADQPAWMDGEAVVTPD